MCADKIIALYHKRLFSEHQGVIKTYLTISDKFFMPNLIHHLRSYIKGYHKYILCIIVEVMNFLIIVLIFQARSEEMEEALIKM